VVLASEAVKRSTARSRAIAARQLRVRLAMEAAVDKIARRYAGKLRKAILAAVRAGRKPNIDGLLGEWRAAILAVLASAFVVGNDATDRSFKQRGGRAFRSVPAGVVARGVEADVRRLVAETRARAPGDLDRLRNLFEDQAWKAAAQTNGAIKERVTAAVVEGGDDIAAIRAKLDIVGIGYEKPHLLQTILRTQLHLGYSAGQLDAVQDPVVQAELWGYEYVAILDDRVRPEHEALDGTKLAKDDPAWSKIMPPNGYNCRCSAIEIWNDEAPDAPVGPRTDLVNDDGSEVVAGPDPGWAFSPSEIVSSA